MGLLRAEIMELMPIIRKYKKPKVLMLGKQDICVEVKDLKNLLCNYGYSDVTITDEDPIDSYELFRALGAEEVHALDCSGYEKADIVFDLNDKELPTGLFDRFDIIIDGGTLEHVFSPGRALDNIRKMLKLGGTVYHMVPCAGLVNHGFYSFSPTFFLDYYGETGFCVDTIRMQYKPERGMYKFVYYSMDCRLFLNQDGFNCYIQKNWNMGGEIMLQCIAVKICEKDEPVNGLTQARYKEIYGE